LMPNDTKSGPRGAPYRRLAELSSLGLMLPSSIAVGLAIGYIHDKLLGTHPWFLAIFTLLGIASGFLSLVRGLKKLGIEKDREDEDND
jgi:ATP synthase protein I